MAPRGRAENRGGAVSYFHLMPTQIEAMSAMRSANSQLLVQDKGS